MPETIGGYIDRSIGENKRMFPMLDILHFFIKEVYGWLHQELAGRQ